MINNKEFTTVIEAREISKSYLGAEVLKRVSLNIFPEEFVLIAGHSGSGKTTLLNMLSATDRPDEGSVMVNGRDITALSDKQRTAYRSESGLIFQRSGLLGGMTAQENIMRVHELADRPIDFEWLDYVVQELSISALMKKRASQMSGGQAQRIGIARALAHQPHLIFADEPTASLDAESTHDVHRVLRNVVDHSKASVVMVSHDPVSQDYVDGVFTMDDGIVKDFEKTTPMPERNLLKEAV